MVKLVDTGVYQTSGDQPYEFDSRSSHHFYQVAEHFMINKFRHKAGRRLFSSTIGTLNVQTPLIGGFLS